MAGLAPSPYLETLLSPGSNDWEPAIAADSQGHVYIATTRYDAKRACATCPEHFIAFARSADGGQTWTPDTYLCRCKGFKFQNDPVFATDERGRLFATWMNNYHVTFARSDDFGETWTKYVQLDQSPKPKWSDKPWIAVSPDGEDVYVVFNHSDPWVAVSHDAGATWKSALKQYENPRYYFAGGITVLPDGTVLTSQAAYKQDYTGTIFLSVLRSTDRGESWSSVPVGVAQERRLCPKWAGCPEAYFGAQIAISSDATGRAYILSNVSSKPKGPSRVYLRSSDDGGMHWSTPVDLGSAGAKADHEFPMIAATDDGDVRVAWMDNRTGRWNLYLRRSIDAGVTFGPEIRVSDRPNGAAYKSKAGFRFPYGDYGMAAIGGDGATYLDWGEGKSYEGPGGTWWARVDPSSG